VKIVFHVSQLKLALGIHDQSDVLPPGCIVDSDVPVEPENVLDTRYGPKGELELLVRWVGKSSLEDSWMDYMEFTSCFPDYQLEGKLNFDGESIDRYKRVYYRKRNTKGGKEDTSEVALATEE